jgi:hypothetical protein
VVLTAIAAVGQEQLDGLLTSRRGGCGIAIGQLDVGKDGPRIPRCGGVTERLLAGDRAANLLAGFVVAAELAERVGEVVANAPFLGRVSDLQVLVRGLAVECGSFLQAAQDVLVQVSPTGSGYLPDPRPLRAAP